MIPNAIQPFVPAIPPEGSFSDSVAEEAQHPFRSIIPACAEMDPLDLFWQGAYDQATLDEAEAAAAYRPQEDYEPNEGPPPYASPPRFDHPTAVQLETRGVTAQIPARSEASQYPHQQPEFWSSRTVWKNTVAAKLHQAGNHEDAHTLECCHSEWTFAVCQDCGLTRQFPNRCDNFFCAECTPRLAHEREQAINWWTNEVSQPKFVTLTCRNTPDLTRAHVKEFKGWWKRLRRRKFARNWLGGFYTLEVTNRGKGWHLHLHALVSAGWIDGGQLAREWCSVSGGMGEIVMVKDARRADYLAKVKSYIVKGATLAKWSPDQICTFILAFRGERTFGVFGNLYAKRTEYAEWIAAIRDHKPACQCGSCNIRYYSEVQFLEADLVPTTTTKPRPPPQPEHPELELAVVRNWTP